MWNKLSMKDRAAYIKMGVDNGITSLDEIKKVYNQYAKEGKVIHTTNKYNNGGPENGSTIDNDRFLGLSGSQWADIGTSMIPIYGTYKDAKELWNNPSWENAGWLGASLISEIPLLKWVKLGKTAKAAKAINKASEVAEEYKDAKRHLDILRETPNTDPLLIREASGKAGKLHLDMKKTTREAKILKQKSSYPILPLELSITGGAMIDYTQALSKTPPPPKYEGNNLKEAIFKAYDEGLEGRNILYNGKVYKALLNDKDLKEYNTEKRYKHLNRYVVKRNN